MSTKTLALILCATLLSSCAQLYMPSVTHTATFNGAGEVQAGAFAGSNGYELQIDYSPFDHGIVAADISYGPGDLTDTLHQQGHRYGELLAGYYMSLGKDFKLNLLAGFGMGKATLVTGEYGVLYPPIGGVPFDLIRTDYTRLMAQAYLCYPYRFNKDLSEFGIALRYVNAHFSDLRRNDTLFAERTAHYLEFLIVLKGGNSRLMFEGQVGPACRMDGDESTFGLMGWLTMSVGARVRL